MINNHIRWRALLLLVGGLVSGVAAGGGRWVNPSEVPTRGEVWPQPKEVVWLGEEFDVDTYYFNTYIDGWSCPLLSDAVSRMRYVVKDLGDLSVRSSAGEEKSSKMLTLSSVTIHLMNDCEINPRLHMDESYQINVQRYDDTKAIASITANSIWGALRGCESFTHLMMPSTVAGQTSINAVNITDEPRFSHRGFMIDTSRHFLPVSTILEMLDLMDINKFNVLHWHIVDSQSFPYQSTYYPDLSGLGAYAEKLIYSEENIATVVDYARARGIRVLPEFDTPGHTDSWAGQPDLLTPCYTDGVPDGTYGPVNPTINANYEFLTVLFAEVAHRFPDHYMHLGGDEVSFTCWASNPDINAFMTANNIPDYTALEEYYFTRLVTLVSGLPSSNGYLVWQEVVDNNVTLAEDTIVHIWKNEDDIPNIQLELEKVTGLGFETILSSCYYLNYISYGVDWHKYYECDPQNFNGSDEQKQLVVGGEACMWAEFVDRTNIIQRSFPRASAVAEKLWSPSSVTTDATAAEPRLEQHRCRMYNRGYYVEPLWPSFCIADYHPIF